jgi:hypothetical protein
LRDRSSGSKREASPVGRASCFASTIATAAGTRSSCGGTGTLRAELRHVAVNHREAAGIVLELEKPTYFYERHIWTGPVERLELTGRRCPPGLLIKLQALVGA